jgi:soluble lytic murein transglycosylase-like protein
MDPDAVSEAGAQGLLQLMPRTAKAVAVVDGSPRANILGGARYLRLMIDRFDGDVELALAAYNAGQQNVDDWLADGTEIAFPETRAYVDEVEKLKEIYRKAYGGDLGG